jgi:aspartate carbamoyltransferase catalytic subunit
MGLRLLSIDDLSTEEVSSLLARAGELAAGSQPMQSRQSASMAFLEPSLRTRTGFLAAAQRLGWPTPVELTERRSSEISMTESVADTFAVLSAYFDLLLVRLDRPIATILPSVEDSASLINCGDRGSGAEHPTQALIDVFAATKLVAELADLHVALVGDLRMRSARSLLKLFVRCPPGRLTLVTDAALTGDLELPVGLGPHQRASGWPELRDVDVINAVGIPHLAASEDVRTRLRVNAQALGALSSRGRVLSPMPVIDEVAQSVRADPRVAFLAQSATAQHVRTALLESLGSA